MKLGEYLTYLSALYPDWDRELAASLLVKLQLDAEQKIGGCRTGMRMKAALVAALVLPPCPAGAGRAADRARSACARPAPRKPARPCRRHDDPHFLARALRARRRGDGYRLHRAGPAEIPAAAGGDRRAVPRRGGHPRGRSAQGDAGSSAALDRAEAGGPHAGLYRRRFHDRGRPQAPASRPM